jgi:hypothetical protein
MKGVLDKDFKYTPVDQQGPDYLARKFDKLRREQKKREEEKQKADEQKPRMLRIA